MAKKTQLNFSEKKHSVKGIISLIIGIISVILLLVLFYLSALEQGNGSEKIGIVGIIIFLISLIGSVIGYQDSREKDIKYYVPVLGLIINSLVFLFLFVLYIIGMFM